MGMASKKKEWHGKRPKPRRTITVLRQSRSTLVTESVNNWEGNEKS